MSGVSKVSSDNAVVEQPKEFRCPKAVPIFVLAIVLALGAVLSHYLNLGMIAVVSFGGCSFVATIIALVIYLKKPAQEKAAEAPVVEEPAPAPAAAPKSKAYVKQQTWMKTKLEAIGKRLGSAIDNGDCFFDAFAKGLKHHLNLTVSVKELRRRVSEKAAEIHRANPNDNWLKTLCDDPLSLCKYDQYRQNVGKTFSEDPTNAVWGNQSRDGQILCDFFQVNLDIFIGEDNDDPNNSYFGKDPNSSIRVTHSRPTLEIAGFRNHYAPVFST